MTDTVAETSTDPRMTSLRIVVADNDPAVVELLCTDLSLEGHDVVASVLSGEAAFEACRVHRPQVLIVDYRMPPGWDGLETISRVRAAGTAEHCILYSNYRSPRIAALTDGLGGIYVKKGPLRALRSALAALDVG